MRCLLMRCFIIWVKKTSANTTGHNRTPQQQFCFFRFHFMHVVFTLTWLFWGSVGTPFHVSVVASAHGMVFRPQPLRPFTGPSVSCYQVLASPQNRGIFTNIVSFLADSSGDFTCDTIRLSICCVFLWIGIFRQVDTPSLAASNNSVLSLDSSDIDFPPEDV